MQIGRSLSVLDIPSELASNVILPSDLQRASISRVFSYTVDLSTSACADGNLLISLRRKHRLKLRGSLVDFPNPRVLALQEIA
jgi:hypothetical protein